MIYFTQTGAVNAHAAGPANRFSLTDDRYFVILTAVG
jgi:hypothetical protein